MNFQKFSGEGLTEPPPQTPIPPLNLRLRFRFSGALRPRFRLRPQFILSTYLTFMLYLFQFTYLKTLHPKRSSIYTFSGTRDSMVTFRVTWPWRTRTNFKWHLIIANPTTSKPDTIKQFSIRGYWSKFRCMFFLGLFFRITLYRSTVLIYWLGRMSWSAIYSVPRVQSVHIQLTARRVLLTLSPWKRVSLHGYLIWI